MQIPRLIRARPRQGGAAPGAGQVMGRPAADAAPRPGGSRAAPGRGRPQVGARASPGAQSSVLTVLTTLGLKLLRMLTFPAGVIWGVRVGESGSSTVERGPVAAGASARPARAEEARRAPIRTRIAARPRACPRPLTLEDLALGGRDALVGGHLAQALRLLRGASAGSGRAGDGCVAARSEGGAARPRPAGRRRCRAANGGTPSLPALIAPNTTTTPTPPS
jgi:hypothetical protein